MDYNHCNLKWSYWRCFVSNNSQAKPVLLKEKPPLTDGWTDQFPFPWNKSIKIPTLDIRREFVKFITGNT